MRRFYLLTGSSTVVPGSGLLGTRRRWLGAGVLALFVVAGVYALVRVMSQGAMSTALSIGVDRSKLLVILVGLLGGALLWAAFIVVTAVTTRPQDATRVESWTTRVFAALCCCLVVFPALIGARAIAIQRDVVGTVFSDGGDPASVNAVKPAAEKKDPWADIPRVNVMLIGADSGKGRIGVRSDSMMVASINTKTGDTVLIGLPRNLDRVPFAADDPLHALYPDGFHCINPQSGVNQDCLLNGIWTLAEQHKDLFPGDPAPGYTETRRALGRITGLTINQSVIIDLKGFQQLVDAMGGVTVDVKSRICMNCKSDGAGGIVWTTGRQAWIEPGRQHLDGKEALWYARSRAQSDDYSRMRRQRCMVGALLDQSNPVKMLANYGALAEVFKNNVTVDIPQSDLEAWVTLVQRIQNGTISSLPITDQVVNVSNPDYAKIRRLVHKAVADHPAATATPTTSAASPSKTSTHGSSTTTEPDDGAVSSIDATC
ncbi:Cell envelope-related transcriptional attenuator [Nostocoides japonicum T1-X7]|uniref:Cell envelope-related transcriptional attenuator n=1 Tax=Nostocoides japonicum T1-X7 TaxID=1194083 RepID=A0A077M182_9MICO|nr:LCP family protein [Tetrasphaera japonica]CCH79576.1 Cell envelope-related transcriptional attenuator [Tetrasphaera japonica T1-X7]